MFQQLQRPSAPSTCAASRAIGARPRADPTLQRPWRQGGARPLHSSSTNHELMDECMLSSQPAQCSSRDSHMKEFPSVPSVVHGAGKRGRPQPCAFDVLFNPPAANSVHSLYACLLACAKIEPSLVNTLRLRRSIKSVLQDMAEKNTLADVMYLAMVPVNPVHPDFAEEWFVEHTDSHLPRAGTALDFQIGASLLAVQLTLIDSDGRKLVQTSHNTPR
eukprot:2570024-Amphidinium_carterae.3